MLDEFGPASSPWASVPAQRSLQVSSGRFWRLTGNEPAAVRTREDFLSFAEPGYARAAIAFLVRSERGGSRVITETRVAGTSPEATRAFLRYWRAIRLGEQCDPQELARAIRRRAARAG